MTKAVFNTDGIPLGFYNEEIHGENIPADAIDITDEQWLDLLAGCGSRAWKDGEIVDVAPPVVEIPEPVTIVYSVDFWTRLDGGEDGNSGEVAQVLAAMEQQSIRTRKIFEAANSYRSDHELWQLLQQLATSLFGEDRAAQILAPSPQQ